MSRITWRGVLVLLVLTVALVWFDACGLASRSGSAAGHLPAENSSNPAV